MSYQRRPSSHQTVSNLSEIPSERFFPFLSLPLELRIQIYQDCITLQNDEGNNPVSDPSSTHCPSLIAELLSSYEHARRTGFNMNLFYPLIDSCRTIRAEATPIFDSHCQPFPTIDLLYTFLRSIGHVRRSQLQRLAFVYHLTFEHGKWVDKLAVLHLTSKCFRLIARECRKLQVLHVYMSVQYLAYYSMTHCSGTCSGHSNGVHRSFYRFSPASIRSVQGMHELRALRGIDRVHFEPATGAEEFSDEMRFVLDEFASKMMEPREERQTKKTVHEKRKTGD